MEHKVEVKYDSQLLGCKKLLIQIRINPYDFLEVVARNYIDKKVDLEDLKEVNVSLISNCETDVIEDKYTWEYDNDPDENQLKPPVNTDGKPVGNSWKQLIVTLRSNVTTSFGQLYHILNGINTLNILNERKKKKRKNKQKEKKNKESGNTGGVSEVDLDDFLEIPDKNKEYLKNLKKMKGMDREISSWTANQFGVYMKSKFKQVYGTDSFEFSSFEGKQNIKLAKGREWSIIKKQLIDVFHDNNLTNQDILNYINWVFDSKSLTLKFPVNLSLICSKSLITNWIVTERSKGNGSVIKDVELEDIDFDF